MAGVNKAIIVGNLGRDPEIRYSQQGTAVVKLAVATTDVWTDQQGQRQERTEWHRVTVFGKQGENCERYLSKGRQVYVEGKLKTSSYEKEGQTHYSTEIIANVVQFLGSRQDAGQDGGFQGQGQTGGYQNQSGNYPPEPSPQGGNYSPEPAPQGGSYPSQPNNAMPGQENSTPIEDDIPF